LEKDGVFKSWAVPKGLPEASGVNRLAVHVEDHPLAFGDFEGAIPEGQYGAGEIKIWDRGSYEPDEWTEARIVFALSGGRVAGRFAMVRFKEPDTQKWLIFRL
jgi:bifunctional non-homologous end joining protein LigD